MFHCLVDYRQWDILVSSYPDEADDGIISLLCGIDALPYMYIKQILRRRLHCDAMGVIRGYLMLLFWGM